MAGKTLKHILSRQFAVTALLPFLLVIVLVVVRLSPQFNSEVENHQRQLAAAITSQVNSYLASSYAEIHAIASLPLDTIKDPDRLHQLLDSHADASISLRSIYIVDSSGKIRGLGLPRGSGNSTGHKDLVGIDLSRNSLVQQVRQKAGAAWSDTFLSLVAGRLTVALAIPSGEDIVVGEIDLANLTEYLKSIVTGEGQTVFVVDRRGQVIADQNGRYTAQEMNLKNIGLVAGSLMSGTETFGTFEFEDHEMVGSIARIPLMDWHVLVAQPVEAAYRPVRTTYGIMTMGLSSAVLLGLYLALYLSRKSANRFEDLAAYARRVAAGEEAGHLPSSTIFEYNQLGEDLRQMADAVNQREQQLRETAQRLKLAMASEHLGVWDWDLQSDRMIWDEQMSELYGVDHDETGYDPEVWRARLHPECRERVVAQLEAALADTTELDLEFRILKPEGAVRDIKAVAVVIRDRDGTPSRMIGVNRDITDQRHLEGQLRQSQKMEAVGQLAGGVAHDFNNILTVIAGYCSMISAKMEPGSTQANQVDQVMLAVERAAQLTRSLLLFSRKEAMEARIIDLNAIVENVARFLKRIIGEDIQLLPSLCGQAVTIQADSNQIELALINLATNARDAMPGGGTLTIEVGVHEMDQEFINAHGFGAPGRYALLTVSDTGVGMDEAIRVRIFEPFFTTKETGKGTGLGMAIIYGIVKQHNGHINVYSEAGRGTTFRIYLPLLAAEPAERGQAEASTPARGGNETILVVEDEPAVRNLVENILTDAGYRVIVAENGLEAVSAFERAKDEIDLVLMDMIMPQMNGREAGLKIRQLRLGVHILFTSGYTANILQDRGGVEEGIELIAKPVRPRELLKRIREMLDS